MDLMKRLKTPEKLLRFLLLAVFLAIFLSSAALFFFGGREAETGGKKVSQGSWRATHESGNFNEYSFVHKPVDCGTLAVVSDPTGQGRGYVSRGEITCAAAASHRLYPTVDLPRCYLGAYRSQFLVWVDIPEVPKKGWISIATYSVRKNWKDLFGLNLTYRDGAWWTDLFHVPVFGKGDFTREEKIPFPLGKWVLVSVHVSNDGLIRVYQDGALVASATREWVQGIPSLCEAHWGLYADGAVRRAVVLNDDVTFNPLMDPSGGR